MDNATTKQPSKSKGESLSRKKVAPAKAGVIFLPKNFQHKPTQTNLYKSVWEQDQTRRHGYAYLRQFSTQTKQGGTGTATAGQGYALSYNMTEILPHLTQALLPLILMTTGKNPVRPCHII